MAKLNNKKKQEVDEDIATAKPAPEEFLIAGLGASAGGIQAFQEFFHNTPVDSGIAYVVILHLSPDHDSKLAQVLQTTTQMPVVQVNEKMKVQPDHIYVISPNQHLTMTDGSIVVSPNTLLEERRAPVDIFFRTLADEHGIRSIAVILSGTGANGSMGLKRIKEKGGATFVQNPREAEFNEMPRNAIATGLVDEVLNVAELPVKIVAYKNSIGRIQISEEPEKRPQDQQQALREIFAELRVRTGHDFSNYKRATLLRRIERRINIHNLPDLPSYVLFMQQNPDETYALLKDLLISVTNFFRDKKAFEIIENDILPLLLKGKTSENQLRIWVAGCATGEEAYSLAILCAEKTAGLIDGSKVQIFATDIDEAAISQAREGLYSINDLADVSPERLRRFFTKDGDAYRIRREVRETVMFAVHNFLKDPPFSHLDVISCRNVMIYLNHVAQERVAETFHFALNPGGFLFLGSSESVDGATDLYASYNRENHIFQSRQATPRAYPIPESVPNFQIDKPRLSVSLEQETKVLERISFGDLHQQLLEQYAAPSLVVNEEYDIVHVSERAGRYLQISGGELSKNLLKLIRAELRLDLRAALYQAAQRQAPVEARGLKMNVDDHPETINIHVRPVLRAGDTARGFILVLFEPTLNDAELRTVNQELKVKIEETSLTSNNLQNLINSTDIGTIFLDRSFRVVLFTPAVRNIFNLIPADYGRPLSDITGKLIYHDLLQDAETVLEKLTTLEQEVLTTENKVFLMRISPYRTTEDRINGVVITFVNITSRKEAEQQLQDNMEELKRFNLAMVSRESRMIELKKEVNELCERLKEPPRYPLNFENEENEPNG